MTSLHDLADAAYDAKEIREMCERLGHVALIDHNPRRGAYLSIMGPSGSGKTTLFNMMGGLDKPTEGQVFIDGVDIAQLDPVELAWLRCRKIGYIFQTFNLINAMTALENVMLPMAFAGLDGEEAQDRGVDILTRVGLGERCKHKPGQLSGGQQQRVAIARALANQPTIFLADEPPRRPPPRRRHRAVGRRLADDSLLGA